ncbi:MAG: hypothetical protein GY853_07145 [PVC group bacterium]|nr:hypothetical protein [PVC group bacterium]
MRKNIKVVGIIVLLSVYMCGCSGLAGNRRSSNSDVLSEQMLGIASQLRFEDLPVPAGFSIIRKSSFIFQNSKTRMGTLTYDGKADIASLIEFYKRTMVYNGWDLINTVEFDIVILNFKKGGESCIVTMQQRAMNRITVVISLSPLAQGSIAAEEKSYETEDEYVEDDTITEVSE